MGVAPRIKSLTTRRMADPPEEEWGKLFLRRNLDTAKTRATQNPLDKIGFTYNFNNATISPSIEGQPMRRGPNGERGPSDVVTNAVHVIRIATGDVEEEYVDQGRRNGGLKGSKARSQSLSRSQRTEIARKVAGARWG